jgi:hypothetical protein
LFVYVKKILLHLNDALRIVVHTAGVNDQRLAKLKADVQRLDRLSVDPKVHHGPPTGSVFNLFQEVGFF